MDHDVDLVVVLRSAARVGANDARGVLEWRQLLERAAAEIARLRADLADLRDGSDAGDQADVIDIVDVPAR